ncbi:hypothetical protein BD779DRAFT_1529086 [Infundibulicybe gibba]|nr:hypothetical protein BD779DRAFT_1529086 [Infundibulicybe gibba]
MKWTAFGCSVIVPHGIAAASPKHVYTVWPWHHLHDDFNVLKRCRVLLWRTTADVAQRDRPGVSNECKSTSTCGGLLLACVWFARYLAVPRIKLKRSSISTSGA